MTLPNIPLGREPLSRLHPVHQHLPERPGWRCRACGAAWPCPMARMLLRAEYGPDRVGLSVYLAGVLFDATEDLMRETPPPTPGELFERFLAWNAPGAPPVTVNPST
ncbi:hypothetical protein GCM10011608_27300 [Micromonospora sonchi]|uniref:Flavin reductase n=1 Tax=Micromonospora sonchi TaxID=1763543 RepID=A0A917WYU7_9ACTN|nr:hypothetical protein [Micromonospora sonchi]GGM41078.1 hypothetical protein GCM10011608_27300 [Micromonospora sonchi]